LNLALDLRFGLRRADGSWAFCRVHGFLTRIGEAWTVASGRRAIHLSGVGHGPGRPAGSRIGNIIVSASLVGRNPESGEISTDPAEQINELFNTMVRFLEAAGVTVDEVIRVNVTLAKPEYRELLNVEWAKYFYDEESLPTRKATVATLPGAIIAELELMAVAS
jgi:enamine deaminase RidA (YjgF/YER057c/UK114 family)